MWYTLGHEKTHLYPSVDRGRTPDPAGGVALVQCLCVASLSDPAGQGPWPDGSRDWRDPGVRRSDRPQRLARLQYAGAGGADTTVLCPPADPACGLRCATARAVAGAAAPASPHLWPRHQSVDPVLSRRGGVCRRAYLTADPW